MAIKCIYDGPYAIQLQLVRTLRPARSKEMSGNNKSSDKSTAADDDNERSSLDSCRPPQYDSTKDSFLVGPLRLYGESGDNKGASSKLMVSTTTIAFFQSSAGAEQSITHSVAITIS